MPKWGSAHEHFEFLWEIIGRDHIPPWLTGVMIDVETWRDQPYEMHGDNSDWLNELHSLNARKFGSPVACKGYFNAGDGAALWPKRDPGIEYIEAHYTKKVERQSHLQVAQQYTDGSRKWRFPIYQWKKKLHKLPTSSAVFGECDHNIFFDVTDGAGFRRLWGRPVHPADDAAKK